MSVFKSLAGFESTRKTLHLYCNAVGVIPRSHSIPRPNWWHVSLKVRPDGLTTDPIPLPDEGELLIRMDLRHHKIVMIIDQTVVDEFSMAEGLSGSEMGGHLISRVAELGLKGDYEHHRYQDEISRPYDSHMAKRFFDLLIEVDRIFNKYRTGLSGLTGPVQFWPHGFDLSFEWFGNRMIRHEDAGEVVELPSQLNLGFSPGGNETMAPYFYSNPWPFAGVQLIDHPLPNGASWHTEGWEGTMLPYSLLIDEADPETILLEYAKAVFDITAPNL